MYCIQTILEKTGNSESATMNGVLTKEKARNTFLFSSSIPQRPE